MTGDYRLRGDDLIQLHSVSLAEDEPCPPGSDVVRARLIESLYSVTHFHFDGAGRLTLSGRDVEVVLAP